MQVRRWLERGVLAVAVLASIATSRRKWHIEATLPASDLHAHLIVVEASRWPTVYASGPIGDRGLTPLTSTQWPGRASYLVPDGEKLVSVAILGDVCKSSGCSDPDCTPPADEYVRVVSTTPIATWRREVTGAPVKVALRPHHLTWQRAPVVHTYGDFSVRVDSTLQPDNVHADAESFHVTWPPVAQPTEVTWTAHVTFVGACPSAEPCNPPDDLDFGVGEPSEDGYDQPQ